MIPDDSEAVMDPLTSLIRRAAPDDPIARTLAAILDSGLILFSRDPAGRFVQLSPDLPERTGIAAARGDHNPHNLRVFDSTGRPLPGSRYPAAIARTTGQPQRSQLMRLLSHDGRHLWLQLSAMPLERWSVLSVAADVTPLCDRLDANDAEIAGRGALLQLAIDTAGCRLPLPELIARLAPPLALLAPDANTAIAMQDGDSFTSTPIHDGYGAPSPAQRGRFTADHQQRWSAPNAHVNRNVQDTDIYGAHVVVELPNPIRSIVIAPITFAPDHRLGALVATSDHPGAFTDHQVETLELTARLAGSLLAPAEALAQTA
jgi:GAF domain-containing protein